LYVLSLSRRKARAVTKQSGNIDDGDGEGVE
jgi:hypothetical protein